MTWSRFSEVNTARGRNCVVSRCDYYEFLPVGVPHPPVEFQGPKRDVAGIPVDRLNPSVYRGYTLPDFLSALTEMPPVHANSPRG